MKTRITLICGILLFALINCTSCSDDCDYFPLDGNDADITGWTMSAGDGIEYSGVISGNTITVCIPEEVDPVSLKAECTLSEGATIYPDPESVSDWNTEQTFTVTSVNTDNAKEWSVRIRRSGEGQFLTPVSITSQKALEEFAALGYRKLNSLTIADGTEPVTDLSPLNGIEEVSSTLTIRDVTAPTVEMTGLRIVGNLTVNSYLTLEKVSFPALRRSLGSIYIGDVSVNGSLAKIHDELKTVEFPALTYVAGSFTVYWCQNVETVNTDKLSHVGRDYVIDTGMLADWSMLKSLRTIPGNLRMFVGSIKSFEGFGVTSVGGTFFFSAGEAASLRPLECLESVESLSINGGDNITSLDGISHLDPLSVTINALPKLTSLRGMPIGEHTAHVFITRMPALESLIGIEKLKKAETIQIGACPLLRDITPVSGVSSVNTLVITSSGVETIPEFPDLKEVPGTLEIYNNDQLTSLSGFSHIKSIGKLTVSDCALLTTLDGLQNVTKCDGAIQIVANPELASYKAVRDLLIANWTNVTIRRNKYNPTLEQLQNGETEM